MASITTEVFYPESDGKPMAESPVHRDVMAETIAALRDWFADDPLAYVSGNEFLYFVEGDPRRNVSPDVWVARGIDKSVRRPSYKTWEEGGKGPDLVIEVSSPSTRREDLRHKLGLYQDVLRVPEYYLFDPLGEYLDPPLQGHRLVDGAYRPIAPEAGRLPSQVLGLHLEADGTELRLFDPAAGRRLLTRKEELDQARAAEEKRKTRERRSRRELRATIRAQAAMIDVLNQRLAAQGELLDLHRAIGEEARATVQRLRDELAELKAERTSD
ncbi:Uma2 family endonuclease [Tundrisphaera sp. TA3]|uniref:Uma2 family endonuclease n=1 Tax=Tundrisphaera sp. TA3 TaxID=3435775 RepID=UPI003EB79E05